MHREIKENSREAELAQLLDELRPGRVVTLAGPGGIGKSGGEGVGDAAGRPAVWTSVGLSQDGSGEG